MDFRVFSRNISENMHARCVREDTKQALKGNLQADGVQSPQTLFVRYCLRACVHRHLPASFRQILLHTALKVLARHQVCLRIFALSATKFARKSAHISYEHKLLGYFIERK